MPAIKIGTAGWSIPRDQADAFPEKGSSLERYAARFPVAEINSSFHRPHRLSTWLRWRDSVSEDFRFSAKLPKTITHQAKLVGCGDLLRDFLQQVESLGDKLAILLVQLPPRLEYDPAVAGQFFTDLASRTEARIACEPRHISWFEKEADELLATARIARVAADPGICDAATQPGGWAGFSYWRLHGSPKVYYSSYTDRIPEYAKRLTAPATCTDTWCIFDNTASSAAAGDALALMKALT